MEDFGQKLRRLRNARHWSLRTFADIAGIDFGYVGQIERGERRCSLQWAEICDATLGANGELLQVYHASSGREDDVRRRNVLGLGGGLVAAAPLIALDALGLDAVPMAGVEALRHDLTAAIDDGPADVDEWEEIAWNYGCAYADTPPVVLLDRLRVDLLVAAMQLRRVQSKDVQKRLQRAAANLSVFMAQTFGNLGDFDASHRWWRTARRHAEAVGDPATVQWVAGREVIRGMYERRPLHMLLTICDRAQAVTPTVGVGTGEVLGGHAQALAMLGREDEARAAMNRVYDLFEHLPSAVRDDTVSVYGWSEYRLRHVESFVYTYLGDAERAEAAYERVVHLYPPHMFRELAQVELHRAIRMVRERDARGGVSHACQVIEELPEGHRIEAVLTLARKVADSVPIGDRGHTSVGALRELAAPPAGIAR